MPHRAQVAHGRVAQRRRAQGKSHPPATPSPTAPRALGQPLRRARRPRRRPSTAPRVPRQRREAQARRRRPVAARRHRRRDANRRFRENRRPAPSSTADGRRRRRLVVAVSVRHEPAARGVEGGRGPGGGRGGFPGFQRRRRPDSSADGGELGREPLRDRSRPPPRRRRRALRLAHGAGRRDRARVDGPSSSPAASASHTPGGPNAQLESVLAKITQEYERRLLTKESGWFAPRETLSEAYKREGRLTQQAEELSARQGDRGGSRGAPRSGRGGGGGETSEAKARELERKLAAESAKARELERKLAAAEETGSSRAGVVSAEAFVDAENAAREAAVEPAPRGKTRAAESALAEKTAECDATRAELAAVVARHERARSAPRKTRNPPPSPRTSERFPTSRVAANKPRRRTQLVRKSQTPRSSSRRVEFARKEFTLVESVRSSRREPRFTTRLSPRIDTFTTPSRTSRVPYASSAEVRPHLPGADGGERDVVEVFGDAVADLENAASQGIAVRTFDKRGVPERKAFSFDRVFGPDATQGGIYEGGSADPMRVRRVQRVLHGVRSDGLG